MPDVPHFDLPFRFTPQAAVVEQDSVEEIAECVLAVLLCPRGYRTELPEYGVPDPTFSTPRVDQLAIRRTIETWEPRAQLLMSQETDALDQLIQRVQVLVRVRTEE
jgi:predicted component of type VI protein secretion system